jgi:N-terminal domain of anti-restriction factor ArdC
MRTDVYQRITDQIVSELEKGVRPWFKPWNAEHAVGRITRPLRRNGIPYDVVVGGNDEGLCRRACSIRRYRVPLGRSPGER